jgi:hypothetical protein
MPLNRERRSTVASRRHVIGAPLVGCSGWLDSLLIVVTFDTLTRQSTRLPPLVQ